MVMLRAPSARWLSLKVTTRARPRAEIIVIDPMSVSAIEDDPDNPDATKLVFKDASERIVWGSRDEVIAKLAAITCMCGLSRRWQS